MLLYEIVLGGTIMTKSKDVNDLAMEMERFQYKDLSSYCQ